MEGTGDVLQEGLSLRVLSGLQARLPLQIGPIQYHRLVILRHSDSKPPLRA